MKPAAMQFLVDDTTALLVCEFNPAVGLQQPREDQVRTILHQPSVVQCNASMARLCGVPRPEALYGHSLQQLIRSHFPRLPDLLELVRERLLEAASCHFQQEGRLTRWQWGEGDAHYFMVSCYGVLRRQRLERLIILHRDDGMSLQQRELQQARHHAFFEQAPLAMCAVDVDPAMSLDLPVADQRHWLLKHARYAECNQAMLRLLNCSRIEDVAGMRLNDTPVKMDIERAFGKLVRQGFHLHDEALPWTDGQGRQQWLSATVSPVLARGELVRLLVVAADVTERMEYTRQIEHRARHDSLSGLPNRTYFHEVVERCLAEGMPRLALCLLDLDGFKEINDTLGHDTGDKLLQAMGPRLLQAVGEEAMVARLGGDEFALLLPNYASLEAVKRQAEAAIAAIQQPFRIHGLDLVVGASLGIALHPEQGDSASALMRCADIAMYEAKRRACRVLLYRSEQDHYTLRRLSLMMDIRQAIANDELTARYQPIVALASGEVVAFELLLRWRHPQLGELMPGEFIPLIELTDLMEPLTWWVLSRAIRVLQGWCEEGWPYRMAVNISARNIADRCFAERLGRLLDWHGVSGDRLILEITESALMADPGQAQRVLAKVGELGVKLSIDDYGTGYSSLVYLRSLPIHSLKIDRTFVSGMLDTEQDHVIVTSTLQLAHSLGLCVTAEGIETLEVLRALQELGCEQGQGFLLARPLRGRDIATWLRIYRRRCQRARPPDGAGTRV